MEGLMAEQTCIELNMRKMMEAFLGAEALADAKQHINCLTTFFSLKDELQSVPVRDAVTRLLGDPSNEKLEILLDAMKIEAKYDTNGKRANDREIGQFEKFYDEELTEEVLRIQDGDEMYKRLKAKTALLARRMYTSNARRRESTLERIYSFFPRNCLKIPDSNRFASMYESFVMDNHVVDPGRRRAFLSKMQSFLLERFDSPVRRHSLHMGHAFTISAKIVECDNNLSGVEVPLNALACAEMLKTCAAREWLTPLKFVFKKKEKLGLDRRLVEHNIPRTGNESFWTLFEKLSALPRD